MFLTDAKIRTLKPSDKPFKVSDSHGLYLLVKPGGSATGISNTVLAVKNPALRWVPIKPSPCLMRDSNVKVSVKCWR